MTRKDLLIGSGIFFIALVLRLWQINGEAINPDEYHWHERTNNFYHVIKEGRWADTMMAGHPGATLTWQSVVSLRTLRLVFRQFDPTFDYQDYPYLPQIFNRVHFAYVLPIVIITSLFIMFLYFALRKLTNQSFALIATFLVLSNVYFLAQSRVVQMDALQTSFIVGSLLTALLYHQTRSKKYFLATAILLSLNIMTKIYGISILPILWVILCWTDIQAMRKEFSLGKLKMIFIKTISFLMITASISILILPAWVFDFKGTITAFRESILTEGVAGTREGNEFFFGHIVERGEPKIFYSLALLFRQSILSFLGLPLALILLFKNKFRDTKIRNLIIILLLTAIYWLAILTIPAKKEDRYILESIVFLDMVAAGGFYWLYEKSKALHYFSRLHFKGMLLSSGFIITGALFLFSIRGLNSEYLGYYNPILGGNKSAVRFIRVGWGEGLKQVTTYLNNLEDPENIKAASWYEMSTAPRCFCQVKPTFRYEEEDVNYLVYYINQIQRQKEKPMTDKYFKKDDIVFESKINGLTYAWVVKKPK